VVSAVVIDRSGSHDGEAYAFTAANMSEVDQATPDPVSFAGGVLNPYRYVCAFVDSRDEEHRVFDLFVSDGLSRGEKLLYFVDSADRASRVRHVRHLGFDLPTLLGQRQCEVRTWSETSLRGGRFDQDAMLGRLDEFLVGSQPGGDVVIDILRTHPVALIGGVLQVNPCFVPTAEFLAELRSRDR
jgi:hypothetical protein